MYAVIFEAQINQLDEDYFVTASRMQKLATSNYGCVEFTSVTDDDNEISISYWESLEQIQKWKQDEAHLKAQKLGKEMWYKSYSVKIVEVVSVYEK